MEKQPDYLDRLLNKHFKNRIIQRGSLALTQNCPPEVELSDYLENRLTPERQDVLLAHLAECSHCLSLLALAQQAKEMQRESPTAQMLRRAKDIAPAKPGQKLTPYAWPILASLSFALSFIFADYFLQFLILAVIFSIKWIFNTGSTRTLVMIYEAWRKKDVETAQRIIRDFHQTRL